MWFYIIFTLSVPGSLELQHFLSSSITLTDPHCLFPSSFLKSHFPQLLLSLGNRHHLSLSVILSPCLLQLPWTKPNYLIIFSHFSLPFLIPFQAHCHRHNRSLIQSLSLSVSVYLSIHLCSPYCRTLVLCVPASLAAVAALRWRVPVHRPPSSNVTSPCWLHQLAYGPRIWGSSIRDGWPEGASVSLVKQNQFTEGWPLKRGCRMWSDISALICFMRRKKGLI